MALARIQTAIIGNLKELGSLSEEEAAKIIEVKEEISGEAMEKLLMEDYGVSRFQFLAATSRAFDLNPFNAKFFKPNESTFAKLDKDFCRENTLLPLGVVGDFLVVALADPFNHNVSRKINEITRRKVSIVLAIEKDILDALSDNEKPATSVDFRDVVDALDMQFGIGDGDIKEEDLEEESAPIIQLANRIIEDAYLCGASDIHIEPFEQEARVRVRIDGICRGKLILPPAVVRALLSRLKVMANLDIAEKRLPQDGRIVFKQFNKKGIDIDLRISTAPLNRGEGTVMRIIDKKKSTLPLPALGFSPENLKLYRELIKQPYGMFLHCGPTGSGKSMTLYSALNEINTPERCIRTAEDPIEYTLPGLCQMQMNRKIGLTFATALRSFLRQDPDIILVGEIRDQETAEIAIEASLTGHMLFSTLHTNDAPSTITRLTEMGIEPFMISASLVCVCSQRLMRRVCKTCKREYTPEGREAEILQRAIKWHGPVYQANRGNCPTCGGLGYIGRVGIHELMANNEDLIKGINAGLETAKLKRVAMRNKMRTLHQDSMLKVRDGLTSIEEAIATIPPDREDIDAILEAESLEIALAC